jgi:hypothetical protein
MTSETEFCKYTDAELREAVETELQRQMDADRSLTLAAILIFAFWGFIVGLAIGRWVL